MKTHTFRHGTYSISECSKIEGVCDVPDEDSLAIIIIANNDFRSLNSALHEALHADGIPDKYLHDADGCSDTERVARFLWRLGYRREND